MLCPFFFQHCWINASGINTPSAAKTNKQTKLKYYLELLLIYFKLGLLLFRWIQRNPVLNVLAQEADNNIKKKKKKEHFEVKKQEGNTHRRGLHYTVLPDENIGFFSGMYCNFVSDRTPEKIYPSLLIPSHVHMVKSFFLKVFLKKKKIKQILWNKE